VIVTHPTAYPEVDTTPDLPHQQNDRARPCREWGCRTWTTRAHAVCERHIDVPTRFGCCDRCQPGYFTEAAS
jgi:hypothetical protein